MATYFNYETGEQQNVGYMPLGTGWIKVSDGATITPSTATPAQDRRTRATLWLVAIVGIVIAGYVAMVAVTPWLNTLSVPRRVGNTNVYDAKKLYLYSLLHNTKRRQLVMFGDVLIAGGTLKDTAIMCPDCNIRIPGGVKSCEIATDGTLIVGDATDSRLGAKHLIINGTATSTLERGARIENRGPIGPGNNIRQSR